MFITMKMLQIRSGLDKLFQIGFHWFLRNKLTIELFNQCFQCTLHIEKKLYCNHQNKLMIEPFHQCIWYTLIKKKPTAVLVSETMATGHLPAVLLLVLLQLLTDRLLTLLTVPLLYLHLHLHFLPLLYQRSHILLLEMQAWATDRLQTDLKI